ncbi:SH3 beta-barrel fold-containing protein [Butyricimonas paravirosa]|uniref:SH3 beta-barrel fold-containing protein n=1 Tax=Butyricimonas paravirosa TaxID=1472417 RepID=UPI0026DED7D1|nr:SH3 beta-barrel fold-containing protein [uncultured Butyricimonas sp.]
MATTYRNQLRDILNLAWQFVRKNGYSMSEALKCAWANFKLKAALKVKVVEFYFKKTDGTLRQAFGTLKANLIGEVKGTGRKPNDNLQVYWDTEKEEYRCFKKFNLIRIA